MANVDQHGWRWRNIVRPAAGAHARSLFGYREDTLVMST
jgi:hypothetical protein